MASILSSEIVKKVKAPSKRAQLTPRVALYIPPHLQKYQNDLVKKKVQSTSNQLPLDKTSSSNINHTNLWKIKEEVKAYHQKQLAALTSYTKNLNSTKLKIPHKKRKKLKLPSKFISKEIKELFEQKKISYESFLKSGSETDLRKNKKCKSKLKLLIRKSRHKMKLAKSNPYQQLAVKHAKWYGVSTPERTASDDISIVTEDNMSDVSSSDEQLQDSSFYFSMKRRMNSRMEWCEAILKFNSDPSYLKAQSEPVKEEFPTSGNYCYTISDDEDSGGDYRDKRTRTRDLNKTPTGGSEFEPVSRRNTQEIAVNFSDNEYLNQQFLRQQHDFERQQKFNQMMSEKGARDHTIFSKPEESHVNFLVDKSRYTSDEKSFDKTLKDHRLHDLNRNKNTSPRGDFDSLLSELQEPSIKMKRHEDEVQDIRCPEEPFKEFARIQKSVHNLNIKDENLKAYIPPKQQKDYFARKRDEYIHSNKYKNYHIMRDPSSKISLCHRKPIPLKRLSPYSERRAMKEDTRNRAVNRCHLERQTDHGRRNPRVSSFYNNREHDVEISSLYRYERHSSSDGRLSRDHLHSSYPKKRKTTDDSMRYNDSKRRKY